MSETKMSQNAFDSEMRSTPSKSGLETGLKAKTDSEYYYTKRDQDCVVQTKYLWQQ